MSRQIRLINILSIVIPVAVALMLGIRTKVDLGSWTDNLPFLNALVNSTTSILLVFGYISIKKGNKFAHKKIMSFCMVLGALFLLCYIAYHISHESTKYGGEGLARIFYYFNLITHIAGSLIVLPFVLRAYYYGWTEMYEKHKKIVRIAFPLWLYVSITGVVAYFMISPYYKF
jgi:putative membrane protein